MLVLRRGGQLIKSRATAQRLLSAPAARRAPHCTGAQRGRMTVAEAVRFPPSLPDAELVARSRDGPSLEQAYPHGLLSMSVGARWQRAGHHAADTQGGAAGATTFMQSSCAPAGTTIYDACARLGDVFDEVCAVQLLTSLGTLSAAQLRLLRALTSCVDLGQRRPLQPRRRDVGYLCRCRWRVRRRTSSRAACSSPLTVRGTPHRGHWRA